MSNETLTGLEQERCESCTDLYDPDEGCQHGRLLCRSCLSGCGECRADLIADHAAETALGT